MHIVDFCEEKSDKKNNLEVYDELVKLLGCAFPVDDFLVKALSNHTNSLLAFE